MTQVQAPAAVGAQIQTRRRARPRLGGLAVNTILIVLMIVWAIPAIGLLVASFRTAAATNASGWWTAFTPPWEFTIENYQYVLGRAGSKGPHLSQVPYATSKLRLRPLDQRISRVIVDRLEVLRLDHVMLDA